MNYNHELFKKSSVISKPIGVLEHKYIISLAFNISILGKNLIVSEQWFSSIPILFFSSIIRPKNQDSSTIENIILRRVIKVLQTLLCIIHSSWCTYSKKTMLVQDNLGIRKGKSLNRTYSSYFWDSNFNCSHLFPLYV